MGLCSPETEATKALNEYRARVAKAKELDSGPAITAGQTTPIRTPTKLPPIVVQIDDIGRITRRKVPVVRPIRWDVWDPNSPASTYEALGLVMRNSLFRGQKLIIITRLNPFARL